MELASVSVDGAVTTLVFQRSDGPLHIRCVDHSGKVPSCELFVGESAQAPATAEERAALEKALSEWVAGHLPVRLISAFETPGMHIRMTAEDTQGYHVWYVLDSLRSRHRPQPERWEKFAESFRRTKA
jgi:hypothetical protein